MSILVDKQTKVISQEMTGEIGTFHTQQALTYGTQMVASVPAVIGAGGIKWWGRSSFGLRKRQTSRFRSTQSKNCWWPVRDWIAALLKQLAIGAIAIGMPVSTAHAQQKVAADGDIEAALGACLEATSSAGIDEAKLAKTGFARGTIESKGKTVETKLGLFGKPNNSSIIMTLAEPNPACTVVARIAGVERFPATVEGISHALKSKPIQQKGNEFTWRRGPLFIQLAATGTREKPSIRTVVMALPEEKK